MAKNTNRHETATGWAYGEITVDDILDAALEIVRAEGVASLTMRRLAEELDMSPMAPYYYVKSKKALLDLLIDRVVGEIRLDGDSGDWQAQYRALIMSAREVFNRYPGILRLLQGRTPTEEQRRLTDESRALLLQAGLDDWSATHVSLFGLSYLFGFLTTESIGAKTKAGARLEKQKYDEDFEFGLDFFLRAVKADARAMKAKRSKG